MHRAYYQNTIAAFTQSSVDEVLGAIVHGGDSGSSQSQQSAWIRQIEILQPVLEGSEGSIFFEYAIPRMGARIDVVVLTGPVIFVLEFKVGARDFSRDAHDQVWDYALDLNYFHETSRGEYIAPILVATEAPEVDPVIEYTDHGDCLLKPVRANPDTLHQAFIEILRFVGEGIIDTDRWATGRYSPTPTIIEAATALYRGHSVMEISRRDAGAENLRSTTDAVSECIAGAKRQGHKAICFVTGVPGAGKTLVGLNIATRHMHQDDHTLSVFLSGNGPLVKVLQEALARDSISRKHEQGVKLKKGEALGQVKAFIQNVHHYRDEYLVDKQAPADHVALFDEAQRAWDLQKTSAFMTQKKNIRGFDRSEPEFLISCIDRHTDWGAIVCLVGGGQEIHTGEAGIGEWIDALNRSYPDWHIHISSRLTDAEYGAGEVLRRIAGRDHVTYHDALHLGVSMRSYRAENVSLLVKHLLDLESDHATEVYRALHDKYPIFLTRDVDKAKDWLRSQARGSERFGMVVSSQAERLKPYAMDVRRPMNPVHWFLDAKEDVRSSYYLEDVATEFSIQGLELDWVGVTWDADLRYAEDGWVHRSFQGSKWKRILKMERKAYQKNAYRVLLTRARQGMVIVVPPGDLSDPTRLPEFYDPTFQYLRRVGLSLL